MLPFEFTILGPPASQQTKNRTQLKNWKNEVRRVATTQWPAGSSPTPVPVELTILYYYEMDKADVDNIIKPIMDALINLAYNDDRQVTDVICRKRSIEDRFRTRHMPIIIAQAFHVGQEFLYIKVDVPPIL